MLHAETTPGRKGATRASFDDYNPRTLVKRIFDESGGRAALPEIQRRVRKALKGADCDFLDAFIDHTTTNCYEAIIKGERIPKPKKKKTPKTLAEKIAIQAEVAARAAAIVTHAKNAWRLEQPAPNGKAIGDCTGHELSQFTGFYKALAQGVGPSQKFRDSGKNGDDIEKAQTWTG